MRSLVEDIKVQSNLILTLREHGEFVRRIEGHNIFLDTGRAWLAGLIAYQSFDPDVVEDDRRIRYMGLGIGGVRQIAPDFADSPPLTDYGPTGAFTQTDTDPTLTTLERPVRISGTSGAGTHPGDVWLGQVQAPVEHPTPRATTFRRIFTQQEVSYAPYLSVPVSEIGLFLSDADPNFPSNVCVAYDTFDTQSLTSAFSLEVVWTLRFG